MENEIHERCETKTLPNVTVQENGIIRNEIGQFIGRIGRDVEFEELNEYRIGEALETLKQAMQKHSEYAHSWHCKVAISMYDSFAEVTHETHGEKINQANQAATLFMKRCFDVSTSIEELQDIVNDGITIVEHDTKLDSDQSELE
jgi:hypothetical protein